LSWYCDVAPGHPVHGPYHDNEYGFPLTDEAGLFERLSLEVFQAGLSWEIVLKKREGLRWAFSRFEVDAVAAYDEAEVARLLADPTIIRNRRKIAATIGGIL
jgi:DNA-3-methyladenine glycosylase I (EC 3.2.2.20)